MSKLAGDKDNGTVLQIQPGHNAKMEAVILFFRKDVQNLGAIDFLQ